MEEQCEKNKKKLDVPASAGIKSSHPWQQPAQAFEDMCTQLAEYFKTKEFDCAKCKDCQPKDASVCEFRFDIAMEDDKRVKFTPGSYTVKTKGGQLQHHMGVEASVSGEVTAYCVCEKIIILPQ